MESHPALSSTTSNNVLVNKKPNKAAMENSETKVKCEDLGNGYC